MRRHDKSARVFNFDRPLFVKEEIINAVATGQVESSNGRPHTPEPRIIPPWEDFPQEVIEAQEAEWDRLPSGNGSVSGCAARGGVVSSGSVESTGPRLRLHTESKTRPPITLRHYQETAIRRIFEEWDNGNHSTLLVLPTGCHDPNQLLLRFDGSLVAAKDVRVGDWLMGPDSTPRRVLALHFGRKPMYRVFPVKGEPFDVTEDHKLSLVRVNEKSRARYPSDRRAGEIVDIEVRDWILWPKWKKHIYKLYRVGVDFNERLTWGFSPYFAGVLLGDGSLSGGSIGVTTEDREIINECYDQAERYGVGVRVERAGGESDTYYLTNGHCGPGGNPLVNAARRVGLWGMECDTKSVPDIFLSGSRTARLEVLAGLIDTDGSLAGSSGYDFISKSPKLSHDVAYLARSLGMAAYVSSCRKCDQNGVYGTYFRVSISGDASEIPVRISRKRASARRQIKDVLRTGFYVEPIGEGDYFGVTVDRDNRYVMGDFTVTHNCGKTITFGSVVYRFTEHYGPRKDGSPRRSLILAHRDELITQAADSLAVLNVETAIEKAEQKARAGIFGDPTCVIASVQSMQANERSKRLLGWDPDYFDLIVTDEGHHAAGSPKTKGKNKGKLNTYQQIYNHFTGAEKRLFVTATPDRADGENMGSICDSLAYEYPMYDAVKEGWLCPIRIRWCDTGVDLRNIRTTGGDLNESDIAEAIQPHIEVLARATKKEIENRKTLVFTPDVGSAEAFASAMESLGIKSASLSGKCSDQERQDVLNAFRRGEIQLLANCALFTEGFDVPSIACVVLLRPTKSRTLYCQMVGRGTRPAPGKENLIVVDFPWVAGKHKLVKPTELFDSTKQSEERYKEAEKILERGQTDDLMSAMQMADKVLTERAKLRIKVREGAVKYRRTEYDPLAVGDILGIPHRQESEGALKKRITEKQLDILRKAKIVNAESMSASRASLYVDKVIDRWRNDKASIPQVSYLIALGVEPEIARDMGFKEASATISQLKAKR